MSKRKPQFDGYAFLNSPEISAYLDQQEAEQAKAARQRPAAVTSAPANPSPAEPEDRTWGEAVHDTRSAISQGVGGLVGGAAWLGNQVGIGDGETAREMAGFSQYLEEEKSAKARSANRAVEKADGVAATLSALIDNPIAVADMVAKSAPLAVPGMGAAGLASRGAAALGKGLVARQMAATVAGVGAESLTSGSMAGNELYQGVASAGMEQLRRHSSRFRELEAETGTAEQAREQLALEVSRAGALLAGAGTAAGGAIAGKVAGRLGLESGYASAVGKNVLTPAGLAKNMGREAMEEAIQSPLEDVGQGVARREADERVNPFDNIGKSALLGAVGAIGQTGATSAVQGLRNGVALREPGQVDSVAPGAPQELAPPPATAGAFDPIAPSQADLLRRAGIEPDPVAEAATASVESIFGAGDPTAGLVASVMRGDALQPIHDLAAVRANTVLPAQSAEGGLFEPQWLPDAATGESAAALPLPKHGFDSQEQLLANAGLDARDVLQRAEIAGQIEAAYAGREPAAPQKARELEALAQESALPVAIERAEQANQLAGALDRAAGVDVPQPTAMQLALQAAQRNTMQANASIGNATQQQTEPVDTGQAPNVSASAPDVLAAAPNISEPAPNISRDDAPRLAHDDQVTTDAPALTLQQTDRGQWQLKGDMAQHLPAIREALPGVRLLVSQQTGTARIALPKGGDLVAQGKQIRKALDHLLLSREQLAQRDTQRMAAGERAKAQNRQARQIDPAGDDILQAVAKLGGIDTEQALSEWWRGQRETIGHYNGEVPGNLRRQGVFAFKRQGGLPIDDMIRRLEGEGYLPQGSTPNDLLDAIEQRQLHPAGMERQAQEAFEARQQEEAPGEFQQAYHDGEFADEFTRRELEDNTDYFDLNRQQREAIEAAAQAADDQFWRDAYDGKQAITPTEEQLDDIFGPEQTIGQGQGEAAAVKNDAGRATTGAQGVQPDGEAEGAQDGFGLTSYTAGDLQRQAQKAERQQRELDRQRADADRRAQADAERNDFTLTGSDRAADVGAANGQGGLFDAPVKTNNPDQKMITKSDGSGFATRDALRASATRSGIALDNLIEKRDDSGHWVGYLFTPDPAIDSVIADAVRAGKLIGTSVRDLHADDVRTVLMAAHSNKQLDAMAGYLSAYAGRDAAESVQEHLDTVRKWKGWATDESLYGGDLFNTQAESSSAKTSAAIDALITEGERRRDAGEPPRKRGDSLAYAPPPGDGDYDSPRNWLTENELTRLHKLQQSLPSAGEERDAAKARIQEKLARRRGGLFSISGRGAGKSGGVFAPDAYDAHQFALAVDRVAGAATAPRTDLGMGDTPTVLRALGANPLPIQMSSSLIHKASRTEVRGHDVPVDVLRNLPSLLADPVMVFDSSTEQGALVVLVDAQDASGRAVVVAVHLNARGGGFHRINKIASVYGKDDVADIERWMRGGLRYYQTKKAAQWLHAVGLQLPEANTIKRLNPRVITNAEIVNARHSFAGQRAKTADQHALGTARQRIELGDDAEAVRHETGWFKGADGKWRFEISDADARLKIGYKGVALGDLIDRERYPAAAMPLAEVLDHPALFAAYPDIAQLRVAFVKANPNNGWFGSFGAYEGRIALNDRMAAHEALSTLLHEIQHGIQNIEGFATGGSQETGARMLSDRSEIKERLNRAMQQFMGAKDEVARSNAAQEMVYYGERLNPTRKLDGLNPQEVYTRLAGEVEARNVQARAKLTDRERRIVPPSQTADVADQDVILVFNGKEMAHAPAIANADTTQPQPTGMQPAELEALLRKVLPAHLQGRVKVVRTAADLPRGGQRAQDEGGIDGVYLPATGELYLVAEAFDSPERALFVLEHELTHYGLRSRYHGFGELTEILEEARSHPVIDRLANAIAADRGMTVDSVRQDLADSWGVPVARVSRGLAKSRLTQETTEEALAELNAAIARDDVAYLKERYGVAVPRTLNAGIRARIARFVQRMKAWLAKATGKQADEYSDLEVWDLLAGVRAFVRDGENVAKEGQDSGENVADFPRSEADVSATARREMAEVRQRYAGTEQWLKAPNGEPTRLNEHQWLQVRTPSFKAWFGDWEGNARRIALGGGSVAILQRGVIAAREGERASDAAYRWLAENPQPPAYRPDVGVIVFDKSGLENSLQHKFGWQKLNAIPAIPSVIRRGVVIDQSHDFDGKPILNTLIAAPITLNGERYQMVVRLRKDLTAKDALAGGKNRFYVHEVVLEEIAATPIKTGVSPAEAGAGRTGGRDRIHMLLHDAMNFNGDASKVVDANGEPLVVYHGTAADFDAFDPERTGDSMDAGKLGIGAYFNQAAKWANTYSLNAAKNGGASNVMPAYLALKNPVMLDGAGNYMAKLKKVSSEWGLEHRPTNDESSWAPNPEWAREFTDAAILRGYDGVVLPSQFAETEYLVFSPLDIKSAIGNRGTFNASDPNILRSTSPNKPAAAGFSLPEETRAQAAQRKGQDNMNRWKQVLGEIQRQGGAVDERNDVYGAEERFHGRAATQIEDFARLEVEPLMRRLADSGHDLKAVEEFLLAQHAEEANAAIREIDPGRDTAYGIEDAEAQALLARYQAMPDFARFEALANDFRRIADGTLELYLRAGIISPDAAAAMRATYQFYVPVKGGDEDQAARQGMGKGLSVNGKQKRRMGHDRREENVLENLLRDRRRAIILAEKNNVGTYLLDLVQRNPDPKLWTVGVLPKQKVLRDRVAYVVQHNGQPAETFADVAAAEQFIDREVLRGAGQAKDFNILKTRDPYVTAMAKPMLQENEVQVYVQGQPLRIQLHDPVLVGQYRRMGTEMMGTLVETGKALNRWLSKVYTGYNPEFFVKNVVRDLTAGTINLTADQGAKVTAKALARWPKAGAAMFHFALNGKPPAGEYGRALQRYRAAGGSTGAAYMGDLERQADTLNTLYENYTGAWAAVKDGKPVKAARIATRKLVGGLAHWFEVWNQAGENAFRLATFMAMEESGKSVAQAASMAKNVTVNFNRKGELTPQLGAAYLFLNPNVQGTARLWQSLFGKDTPHKAQAWAMVGGMVGLALALAAMNRADDDDEWEATPDSVKDRNLLVPLGNGRKLTIPLPYGYSFFVSMANRLDAVMHGESAEKAGIRMASALFENFSPVGNPIGDNPDSKNLINMMPTAAKIVLQPAANITDFGGPMRPEYDQNQPDNEKMWRGTRGGVYDQAAQFVSDRVGSKYENDWADISPETLKYLVRTFTGGTGAFMADSASLLNVLAAGAEPDLAEVPFARSGARDMTVKDLRARFNELGGEARQHVDAWKRAVKAGDDAEATRYEQDGAMMAMGELMEGYAKQARTVRDLMAAELRRDDLSLAAKRALQRRHEADEAAVYQEFIREFKEARR